METSNPPEPKMPPLIRGIITHRYPSYAIFEDGKIYSATRCKFMTPYKKGMIIRVEMKERVGDKLEKRYQKVHDLVTFCFLPEPFPGATLMHLDCDVTNNAVSNLAWIKPIPQPVISIKPEHPPRKRQKIAAD
jgi:hypothetical protein